MVLINSLMPPEVILFLRNLLKLTRFILNESKDEESQDMALNSIFEQAGYSSTKMSENMSVNMNVILCTIVGLALLCCVVDQLFIKSKKLKPCKCLKTFLTSFITFAAFLFAYCLFEITLCAMIEIRASDNPLAWFILILGLITPLVLILTLFVKFDSRFKSGEALLKQQASET